MMKNSFALRFISLSCCVLLTSPIDATPNCVGSGVSSCSGVGATSETCSQYYLSAGTTTIQCKWNGSYCSDGGGNCLPGGKPNCPSTYTSNCGSITSNPPCTSSYTSDGHICAWNSYPGPGSTACYKGSSTCTTPKKCHGSKSNSCGNIANVNSSNCGNYYISGYTAVQCKWNGSSCSDGGGTCMP